MGQRMADAMGTATAIEPKGNVSTYPGWATVIKGDDPSVRPPSWFQQRLIDLKVKTMADTPTKPYWNPTMVSAWCAVVGAVILILGSIAGLYVYTRSTSLEEGRRLGVAEEKDRQQQTELENQATKIAQQEKLINLALSPDEVARLQKLLEQQEKEKK